MNELLPLQVYGWVLDKEQTVAVKGWVDAAYKADVVAAAHMAVGRAKAAAAPKATSRRRVQPSAREAVLALLS